MDPWFSAFLTPKCLSAEALRSLQSDGFIVIEGPVKQERVAELAGCYDRAVELAAIEDVKIGSTTTRITDFVNRGPEFDELYVFPPLLEAACQVIREPFKLSTLHARTLRAGTPAQRLHVDFVGDSRGWPMLGFIFMVDAFTAENGATCFVPHSQGGETEPQSPTLIPACGKPGSIIVFNGSIWHGHGANKTSRPRRSIQGAFIRRTDESGANLPTRMRPETLNRIGSLAKYLLTV
ncbi:MAG TPA: phytanoyl-CoA dioxygenase family protein [Terriglobales bacterium]|nr:phytanoyl-CoA dioxygenase family protein [Terriglobales bacterium]